MSPLATSKASSKVIRTPLTDLLGCTVPIVLAPMSTGAGGKLAAEITNAGGFGCIPAGDDTAETLKKEIQTCKDNLLVKVNNGDTIPIAVGYLGWFLDLGGHDDLLITALALKVKAIVIASCDHMDRWVSFIRGHDKGAGDGRETLIILVVHSYKHAVQAANLNVHAVIVQGIESGGHGASYEAPLSIQISVVQRAFAATKPGGKWPLIIAAGGITNGSHIAGNLAQGAHGCLLGSRFVVAKESYYSDSQRAAVCAIEDNNSATERTLAFDEMVGSMGWPQGIDGRALRNLTTAEYDENKGQNLDEIKKKYEEAAKTGDANRIATWAGLGCVLLTPQDKDKPAKDIMEALVTECQQCLKNVAAMAN
ncbi:2-nitropropane dioxygenase [Mycena kentingensis (nom. inval.)]|nr:2-nitropropane dioxygenase [Mycena kentingensis (nom. inval.)]